MRLYCATMRISDGPQRFAAAVIAYDHPFETRVEVDGVVSEPLPLLSFDMPEAELRPFEIERDQDGDRRFFIPAWVANECLDAAGTN